MAPTSVPAARPRPRRRSASARCASAARARSPGVARRRRRPSTRPSPAAIGARCTARRSSAPRRERSARHGRCTRRQGRAGAVRRSESGAAHPEQIARHRHHLRVPAGRIHVVERVEAIPAETISDLAHHGDAHRQEHLDVVPLAQLIERRAHRRVIRRVGVHDRLADVELLDDVVEAELAVDVLLRLILGPVLDAGDDDEPRRRLALPRVEPGAELRLIALEHLELPRPRAVVEVAERH